MRRLKKILAAAGGALELKSVLKTVFGHGVVLQAINPSGKEAGYFSVTGFRLKSLRLSSTSATLPFEAIEVLLGRDFITFRKNLRNWFKLLNAGYRVFIVGSSGSRAVVWDEGGYPRTYVAVSSPYNEKNIVYVAAQSLIRSGDAFVSTGPFLRLSSNGTKGFGSFVRANGGRVRLDIEVLAAPRIALSSLTLFVNGKEESRLYINPTNRKLVRVRKTLNLVLTRDSWLVCVVKGERGMSLTHVGRGLSAMLPVAVSNPVWFDVDGDGVFTAPIAGVQGQK